MSMTLTRESIARALTQAIGTAWAATPLGAPQSLAVASAAIGDGWTVAVPFTGAASGTITLWFERAGATDCAGRVTQADIAPTDDDVVAVLVQVVARAMESLESSPDGAGLTSQEPAVRSGEAPAGVRSFVAQWTDVRCHFSAAVELKSASVAAVPAAMSPADDARLEAVLDVDLPLVVRFGRVVMPMRAVADLSPGSVVDMGRSPDEPVEMLVGERLIARGEVVIVGGNYGVRITELTNGRRATDVETRS